MQSCAIRYFIKEPLFILKLEGKLQFFSSLQLQKALELIQATSNVRDIVLDLTLTKYIDSTILGCILQFFADPDWCEQDKARPIIICHEEEIINILKRIGFDQLFTFAKSDERLLLPDLDKHGYEMIQDEEADKKMLEYQVCRSHETLSHWTHCKEFGAVSDALKDKKINE